MLQNTQKSHLIRIPINRIGQNSSQIDCDDFAQFLLEHNISHKKSKQLSESQADLVPFPEGIGETIKTGLSERSGTGIFSTCFVSKGQVIGPAAINLMRTPIGRYLNHSKQPSAKFAMIGRDVWVVAARDIQPENDEITVNYRQVLGFEA